MDTHFASASIAKMTIAPPIVGFLIHEACSIIAMIALLLKQGTTPDSVSHLMCYDVFHHLSFCVLVARQNRHLSIHRKFNQGIIVYIMWAEIMIAFPRGAGDWVIAVEVIITVVVRSTCIAVFFMGLSTPLSLVSSTLRG